MKRSDKYWNRFGEDEPYYWVTTNKEYHGLSIDHDKLQKFFAGGEQYRKALYKTIQRRVYPDFSPVRILDFGCGVGRILLPMAQHCESAVGLDIAGSMLNKAIEHSEQFGLENVTFELCDDSLVQAEGKFDFIHSIYVFQHIPCRRGYKLFRNLLKKLSPGGVAVIHLTYANDLSLIRNIIDWIKCHVPLTLNIVNMLHFRAPGTPMMEMHNYSINRLIRIVQEMKGANSYLHFTRVGPFRGVMMFIRMNDPDPSEFSELPESP
jgi:ubiquinone/menaquinone biosynthesis C-methylase UbiE